MHRERTRTEGGTRVLLVGLAVLLGSCASDTVGLRARGPEYEACVLSLNPTLHWDAFDAATLVLREEDPRPTITNVTYELRLWHEGGERIDLVYRVQDLPEPVHELPVALLAGHRYRWSVRAWFELDGRLRTTRWSLVDEDNEEDAVPNSGCAWFETPAPATSDPAGSP